MADQGRRILAEEDRLRGRGHAALGGVVAVVQADADDLPRDPGPAGGAEPRRGHSSRSRGPGPTSPSLAFRPSGQQALHARRQLGIGPVHVDISALEITASPRSAVGRNGYPAHGSSPSSDGILVDVSALFGARQITSRAASRSR